MAQERHYDMKDSGVEWIGMIPKGWKVSVVKRHYSITLGKMLESTPKTSDVTLENYMCASNIKWGGIDISVNRQMCFSANEKEVYLLKDGDLLVMEGGATAGTAAIYQGEFSPCYIQNSVNRCRSKNGNVTPFLYYWLYFVNHSGHIESVCNCATFKHLTKEKLGRLPMVQVPLPEQTAIVAYLDEKCTAIDSIIAEAKATIEEYKAWKASVIFEAVTKGLDPNAEMKDSGVEWIGRMPKGWKICKLKWLCDKITDGSHFSSETTDDGYPYITASDVNGIGLDYRSAKKISPTAFDELQKSGCRPLKGDVLLVKDGATTGRIGLMTDNEPCVALSSVAILRPAKKVSSYYLMYIMMSEVLQFQIRKSMAGSAMPRTTLSKLVDYITISCPLPAQEAIVAYLDSKCAAIDAIIAEKEALIGELEAYKKSLIFETVTGKRRVC